MNAHRLSLQYVSLLTTVGEVRHALAPIRPRPVTRPEWRSGPVETSLGDDKPGVQRFFNALRNCTGCQIKRFSDHWQIELGVKDGRSVEQTIGRGAESREPMIDDLPQVLRNSACADGGLRLVERMAFRLKMAAHRLEEKWVAARLTINGGGHSRIGSEARKTPDKSERLLPRERLQPYSFKAALACQTGLAFR